MRAEQSRAEQSRAEQIGTLSHDVNPYFQINYIKIRLFPIEQSEFKKIKQALKYNKLSGNPYQHLVII